MMKNVIKLGTTLLIVGLVAAIGLGFTYGVTKDKIATRDREQEAEACMSALPEVSSFKELKEDRKLESKLKKKVKEIEKVFSSKGGFVFLITTKGYGGNMNLAIGVGKNGKVAGISVISQNETPGLGGNCVKPEFLKQFKGKKHSSPLEVGKDIQAITGATITTRAVAKAVKIALKGFEHTL
ncbi:MAG: RnfABCDGE type electron transport complex subunit G [Actinomycetota bacterium]|nr:RnfABCDGE type electron transport complex subunit G [Actinomycetota bacterium]